MRANRFKRGFTLIEVNLAIFILGTGVLTTVALFSLGFRENRQSVEDVAAAAYADAYFAPFVQALSATNLTWKTWTSIGDRVDEREDAVDAIWPKGGWGDYVLDFKPPPDPEQNIKPENVDKDIRYRIRPNSKSIADGVANQLKGVLPNCGSVPSIPSDYYHGFVVTRSGATIQLAIRIARRRDMVLAQGVYAVEVRYQGDPNRTTGGGQ